MVFSHLSKENMKFYIRKYQNKNIKTNKGDLLVKINAKKDFDSLYFNLSIGQRVICFRDTIKKLME